MSDALADTERISIDLVAVAGGGHTLLGKERGISVRKHFDLDTKDADNNHYVVVLPEALYSISSSFFSGMFSQSVKKLHGQDAFFEKYYFDGPLHLRRQVLDSVEKSAGSRERVIG